MLYNANSGLAAIKFPLLKKLPQRARRDHTSTSGRIPCRVDHCLNSFFPRTVGDWNTLPPEMVSAPSTGAFISRWQNSVDHHFPTCPPPPPFFFFFFSFFSFFLSPFYCCYCFSLRRFVGLGTPLGCAGGCAVGPQQWGPEIAFCLPAAPHTAALCY